MNIRTKLLAARRDYERGMTYGQLARKYGCSAATANVILRKAGVSSRPGGPMPIQHTRISEIFNPSSPFSAYVLGLFVADGHASPIRTRSTNLSICVHSQDSTTMKKILARYGGSISIQGNTCLYRSPSSVDLRRMAADAGLLGAKTTTATLLDKVPEALRRHALRGLWDGDGSVVSYYGARCRRPSVRFVLVSGSTPLVREINGYLKTQGFSPNCFLRKSGRATELRIDRVADLERFYEFLYKGSRISFARKMEKSRALLNLRKQSQGKPNT